MIFKGYGIVWDAENNTTLCEFIDGKLETIDERVIEILKKLNYNEEVVVEKKASKKAVK